MILFVALIFVGPDKLPKVAKTIGAGLRDLRRAANLAQAELRETMDDLIREADLDELKRTEPVPRPPPRQDATEPTTPAVSELPTAPQVTALPDDPVTAESAPTPSPIPTPTPAPTPASPEPVAVPVEDDVDPTDVIGRAQNAARERLHTRGAKAPDPGFSLFNDDDDDDDDDNNGHGQDDAGSDDRDPFGHQPSTPAPAPPAEPPPAAPPPQAPPPATPAPTTPPPSAAPADTVPRTMPPMRAGSTLPTRDKDAQER